MRFGVLGRVLYRDGTRDWCMAKLTIITLGTRGDVQPYVALGIGLR